MRLRTRAAAARSRVRGRRRRRTTSRRDGRGHRDRFPGFCRRSFAPSRESTAARRAAVRLVESR
ncbi:50S ribosomal protein L34 [Mycobacterium avium subsp. paratuberculosis 10-4404]|nr:50S ribosomal protein L34 [Mycobacterium avium subsp. paratuberculosis 10-4404]ETB50867.1 50S ribosomal protein L34 [Mycobacterium avium subsp. paratuberculosis 10-8425]